MKIIDETENSVQPLFVFAEKTTKKFGISNYCQKNHAQDPATPFRFADIEIVKVLLRQEGGKERIGEFSIYSTVK